MPRGSPPMPLQNLVPYYRGAPFSLIGLRLRHPDLPPEVVQDIERRITMLDRFSEAAAATYRLQRQRQADSG